MNEHDRQQSSQIAHRAKHESAGPLSNKLEMMAISICRGSISRIEDQQRTVMDINLYGLAGVLGVLRTELFEEKP